MCAKAAVTEGYGASLAAGIFAVQNRGGRRLFTLVEMLVVIAIIGILASLLMPSLRRALEAANTVNCTNNLKQIGGAFSIYSNDFSGWYPTGTRLWQPFTTWGKAYFFNTYLGGKAYENPGDSYKINNKSVIAKSAAGRLYKCPSSTLTYYLQNDDMFGYQLSFSRNYQYSSVRPASIKGASKIANLLETWNVWDDAYVDYYGTWTSTNFTNRHNGCGNILFQDGHVELYDKAKYMAFYKGLFGK